MLLLLTPPRRSDMRFEDEVAVLTTARPDVLAWHPLVLLLLSPSLSFVLALPELCYET